MEKDSKKNLINIINRSQVHFGNGDNSKTDKIISTTKNKSKNSSWGKFLIYLAAVVTVLGFIWAIYIYFNPNKDVAIVGVDKNDKILENQKDLRDELIGSIFDIGWELNQLKTDLDKTNFIEVYKGKNFNAFGIIQNVGKASNKEVWAIIRGDAKRGNSSYVHCTFDKSWESVLKNMIDLDEKSLSFTGEIDYSFADMIIAKNCIINDKINN